MNISRFSRGTLFGRLLRLPLDLIPKGTVLPILRGYMRGLKWVKGSGEHGYWLGTYEQGKRLAIENEVKPGQVFFDIGANVGYFSLLAIRLSEPDGKVFSFEPLSRNLQFLHKHIALNHLDERVKVIEAAVSNQSGSAFFDLSTSTSKGHISEEGQLAVRLVCLDDLVASGELPMPDLMKVDVEGAEFEVLSGARNILETKHPVLFLDTHARDAHEKTISLLLELGYELELLDGKPLAESKEIIARWSANPHF